jgi:hypothetical protein
MYKSATTLLATHNCLANGRRPYKKCRVPGSLTAGHPLREPAMNATGTITMTMREVDRLKVIQAVTESRLKPRARWT